MYYWVGRRYGKEGVGEGWVGVGRQWGREGRGRRGGSRDKVGLGGGVSVEMRRGGWGDVGKGGG